MPNRKNLYTFPRKAVFPFVDEAIIAAYVAQNDCKQIGEFLSVTKAFPIYETIHNGQTICLCQAPVGASAAVQFLDFLIGYGAEEIISAGSCGALVDFLENKFLIPTEALRDEGVSYHYLPPSRSVMLNMCAVDAIKVALQKRNMPFTTCKTWTTDGFYRETAGMVAYRKSEGCTVVEMECAGLAACAAFRSATFGQILFTADTLANTAVYDERDWGYASHSPALELALDAVCEL